MLSCITILNSVANGTFDCTCVTNNYYCYSINSSYSYSTTTI